MNSSHTNDSQYVGGCLCGQLRFEASGEARNLSYCHCNSCRRAVGAAMVPWGTFAENGFRITQGQLAEYRSSPRVRRGFCAHCGTSLTYRHEKRPGEVDVVLAALDEPGRLAPRAHIWVRDKLPWVVIADGLPQFEKFQSNE
jgi:hypothetical protein